MNQSIEATKVSRFDYMGFAWHTIKVDGELVTQDGTIVKYHAIDKEHAIAMHLQITNLKNKIMYYEINVALVGRHFFATDKRSITTESRAVEVLSELVERFPKKDGYNITITKYENIGKEESAELFLVKNK